MAPKYDNEDSYQHDNDEWDTTTDGYEIRRVVDIHEIRVPIHDYGSYEDDPVYEDGEQGWRRSEYEQIDDDDSELFPEDEEEEDEEDYGPDSDAEFSRGSSRRGMRRG